MRRAYSVGPSGRLNFLCCRARRVEVCEKLPWPTPGRGIGQRVRLAREAGRDATLSSRSAAVCQNRPFAQREGRRVEIQMAAGPA